MIDTVDDVDTKMANAEIKNLASNITKLLNDVASDITYFDNARQFDYMTVQNHLEVQDPNCLTYV